MKSNLFLCFRCGRRFDENHIGHVDDHMEICDVCNDETEKCVVDIPISTLKTFRRKTHERETI